jgi:hypothetical protein
LDANTELTVMDEDLPFIRCPCCGSLLTSPLEGTDMWECRYHLCRAVFPVFLSEDSTPAACAAEKEPGYRARNGKKREIA